MTIRGWVVGKLTDAYAVDLEGEHGLRIERGARPTALVYCAETNENDRFTADDLDAAWQDMPGVQFVVLVKRDAANEAYELAEKRGICISGFSELKSALAKDFNIAEHLSREQAHLRGRLEKNRHVCGMRRRGKSAYEISRKGVLSTLNVVTITHYELTSDSVYELLDENDGIDVDAIVTTNPNCRGFAREALDAGNYAGIRILTLHGLLDSLGDTWI
jgi:hypothetical protein